MKRRDIGARENRAWKLLAKKEIKMSFGKGR